MPVTDAYATIAQYRGVVGALDATDEWVVTQDLLAISRWLEKKLGRHFTKDASAVARVFAPPGATRLGRYESLPLNWAETENPYRWGVYARTLVVDDLAATPTSVKVDDNGDGLFTEAALASTDYEPWPLNADKGSEPRPWTELVIPSWSTRGGWPAGRRVEVVAQWGWPAVPVAIVQATSQLTALLRRESPQLTQRAAAVDAFLKADERAVGIVRELIGPYGKTGMYV